MIFRINGRYITRKTLTILFQGCLHRCEGCTRPDLWPMYGGNKVDTECFKKMMADDPELGDLAISGGEPFLQPQAALDLAIFAKSRGLKVWCYTGYRWEDILQWEDNRRTLLTNVDVLMDDRGGHPRVIDVQKSLEKGEIILKEGEEP